MKSLRLELVRWKIGCEGRAAVLLPRVINKEMHLAGEQAHHDSHWKTAASARSDDHRSNAGLGHRRFDFGIGSREEQNLVGRAVRIVEPLHHERRSTIGTFRLGDNAFALGFHD